MKKVIKCLVIAIIILGISFSTLNFFPADVSAQGLTLGTEQVLGDGVKCLGDEDDCEIIGFSPY
jgi:hypothetical protein